MSKHSCLIIVPETVLRQPNQKSAILQILQMNSVVTVETSGCSVLTLMTYCECSTIKSKTSQVVELLFLSHIYLLQRVTVAIPVRRWATDCSEYQLVANEYMQSNGIIARKNYQPIYWKIHQWWTPTKRVSVTLNHHRQSCRLFCAITDTWANLGRTSCFALMKQWHMQKRHKLFKILTLHLNYWQGSALTIICAVAIF